MSKDTEKPASKPPKHIKVDVQNPRYEGATFEMVVKAMLQRPRKADQEGSNELQNEPDGGNKVNRE